VRSLIVESSATGSGGGEGTVDGGVGTLRLGDRRKEESECENEGFDGKGIPLELAGLEGMSGFGGRMPAVRTGLDGMGAMIGGSEGCDRSSSSSVVV